MYHHYTRSAEDTEIKTRIWQKCDPQVRVQWCELHALSLADGGRAYAADLWLVEVAQKPGWVSAARRAACVASWKLT